VACLLKAGIVWSSEMAIVRLHVEVTNLWGEVSMCDTPPTLITVHVGLVQHFIAGTVLQLMI
jgi:hypothetical protein